METRDSLLEFWFGNDPDDAVVAKAQASIWWAKDRQTDAAIRQRFQPLVAAAAGGNLDDWRSSGRGQLALILLTDQLPRNIYRDTPGAFQFDGLARTLSLQGLANGSDRELRPIERVFFYLPLEHSESLEDQKRSVQLFRALAGEVPPIQRGIFDGFVDYALRHQAIIERFGRFPHRNMILGRPSTPEEIAFLQEPQSSF
jgi:uncharacterized protein (DUF924 family)